MFEVQFFVFGLLSFAKIAKFAKISTPKVISPFSEEKTTTKNPNNKQTNKQARTTEKELRVKSIFQKLNQNGKSTH